MGDKHVNKDGHDECDVFIGGVLNEASLGVNPSLLLLFCFWVEKRESSIPLQCIMVWRRKGFHRQHYYYH
mgnify:CR=1 FL=1